jgi:hypothetical protein
MGLFSRDETIYVSSVIYPLGPELDKIPDMIETAVIGSKLQNQNTPVAIKKAIIDGLGIKLRQAYAYAAKSYYSGLPIGLAHISNSADPDVIAVLTLEYLTALYAPSSIDLKSVALVRTTNHQTIVHQQVETKYNYDFALQRVHTTVFGIPVDSTLALFAIQDDPINHPDEYGWRLTFTKPDTTIVTFDEWYLKTLFSTEDDLIKSRLFIEISVAGGPTQTISYTEGGSDAQLNLFLQNISTNGSGTFPGLVLKKNNRWFDEWQFHSNAGSPPPESVWKNTSSYKTSKVYARKLGVEIPTLISQIKESPDEGQIDYVFIQPGTKIASPNQCAHEYHWNYFNRLRLSLPDNKPLFDAWYEKIPTYKDPKYNFISVRSVNICPSQSISITDPETAGSCVNMEIAWRYMTYEEKSGALAQPYETEVSRDTDSVKEVTYGKGKGTQRVTYDFTKFYIRKRLTESTYAELMIFGLWHENYVYKGKYVSSGVWDAFNDPDGDFGTGFLIPLEMETYLTLSGREQLQLAQEALHIVFNCYKVVKEKWYQTGFFQFVTLAFSFVITVISLGSLGPTVGALYGAIYSALPATLSIAAATAIATVLTAVVVTAVVIGVQYVAVEAGEWAAEQWGSVWGAIVQVVVTVALTWGIGQLGQIYLNIPITPITLTQQLMSAASFIFGGLAAYTQYEMELIQEEWDKWSEDADERETQMKQLEELWEENFPELSLPAQMWLAPVEKLEDWLARTQSTTDTLVNRLIAPVEFMSEITLTPRLQ